MSRWISPSFVAILGLGAALPLAGQGWIEPDVRRAPDFGVVKVRTAVSVRVAGRIAQVEVEEWFENRGGRLGEGDYLYPLPGEAVFSNFSLYQGDQELRGETMNADEARAIYEEIVRRKRDPALIELAGHGLIRARVFPINPGETRKITLRYTQVLTRAGDALQFRYSAGRHHAPIPDPRSRGGEVAGRPGRPAPAPASFVLTADGEPSWADPFSPTHALDVRRRDGRLEVRTRDQLSGDLNLFLPFARPTVGLTVVTHRPAGEDGYFMLTLSPGTDRGRAAARDVAVVVDVSGSMSGSKLAQAQAALHQLLGTLGPDDRFRLVRFSNRVDAAQADWQPATREGLAAARRWVDALTADGGTNIAGALEEAFRVPSPRERLPIVIFLTDGLPSVGERDPERIAAAAEGRRGRARVFAFGVGHDVNTYLLDRLSAAGRGATEYVEPGEDVERALSLLAAKVQHPVLTDLALETGVRISEVHPGTLPDLFHGQELIVFGRYRPAARSAHQRVTITGRRNGRAERYATTAPFPAHAPANDFIPRLWAARKLGALQQAVRLEGPNEELLAEIRRTALRYGLLSEYTSYLVLEPDMVASNRPGRPGRSQFAPLPAAAPAQASGAGAVATARADRQRREADRLSDVAAAEEMLKARAHGPDARPVAGRWFVQRDGIWTDLAHGDSLRVITVEPFSPAHVALAQALPELAPVLAAFDRVLVAGVRVSIRLAPGGRDTLADLPDVVRAFRGP